MLSERAPGVATDDDPFMIQDVPQIRVLKLVQSSAFSPPLSHPMREGGRRPGERFIYQVELWQLRSIDGRRKEKKWQLVRTLTPARLGKPLSCIPFIFHGAAHARPAVEKSPIEDIVAANLDHYRLNTDYKYGMHFTALLNDALRWVYWWQSTEATPVDVTTEHIGYELNSDFEATVMSATEIQALVAAWQSGAISRDTLLHNFRTGEILPPARTNDQEIELILNEPPPVNVAPMLQPAGA